MIITELSGKYPLALLLNVVKLPRSSFYYARAHTAKQTRPDLHEAIRTIFSRTSNGCGHRQVAMSLRNEFGAKVSNKTVLKVMNQLNLKCRIRRKGYRKYSSFKGIVGFTFQNLLERNFKAEKPWEKLGTDVTEFCQPWGKAYFAPIYDFGSKEIVAWETSESPNMAQQNRLLDSLLKKLPAGSHPILHSDMGWQYQHRGWCQRLHKAGIIQSMSRKGNCIDNAATEQVFGHLKDEFFRGRVWLSFQDFKEALDAYVIHWNTKRRQVKLKGLTPEEFRRQSLRT